MLYKVLYKKNNTKNIIQWEIHYDDISYWTQYGIVNGKQITTKPTFVTIKNIGKKHESTIDEQIIKEMDSLIKYKLDSDGYYNNINDVDTISDKLAPMLAHKYDEYSDDIVFVQPKLDGVRCLINKKENYSRKFNTFHTVKHIEDELSILFEKYPSITFDGELYNNSLSDNFNKIVSLVKKSKPSDKELFEIINNIEYHIYDMFDSDKPDLLYSDRISTLNNVIKDFKYVKIVQTEKVSSQEEIDTWFEYFTSIGYEGAILRKNTKYEHKRSKSLLKLKQFMDDEYEILDIVTGEGNRSDIAAKFIMKDKHSTQSFKASITGTFEYCHNLIMDRENIIGKLATIQFFCLTPIVNIRDEVKGGVPRFGTVLSIRDYE